MDTDEKFWSKVTKGEGCWLWTGAGNGKGYGLVRRRKISTRPILTHRYAWMLVNGPIPKGKVVIHSCDVRSCVNPGHLSIGSQSDNLGDMARKGRSAHGVKHPGAKFTEDQVREVRRRYEAGGVTYRELAEEFDVATMSMFRIVNRHRYPHVT